MLLAGCSSHTGDIDWHVKPGEATDSIAIEHEAGDMVCVREMVEDADGNETSQRTCVPSVTAGGDS